MTTITRFAWIKFGPWGHSTGQTYAMGVRTSEAPRHRSATGYGSKIPTHYEILHKGRWRRVYCTIYSNSGTCWINVGGERLIVDIEEKVGEGEWRAA